MTSCEATVVVESSECDPGAVRDARSRLSPIESCCDGACAECYNCSNLVVLL